MIVACFDDTESGYVDMRMLANCITHQSKRAVGSALQTPDFMSPMDLDDSELNGYGGGFMSNSMVNNYLGDALKFRMFQI